MHKLAIYLFLLGLCGAVALSPLALAQQSTNYQQPAGQPPQQQQQQQSASTGQQGPPAELPTAKDLGFFIGKWDTKISSKPNELTPEGVNGKGTAEFNLFGQAIQGTLVSESTRGHHETREFIVYEPGSNAYMIFTVNDRGVSTQRTLSRYVDTWVVEYNGQTHDKEFTVRGRYTIVSDNELHYSSEIDVGKAGYKPFIDITLTRKR
ncbi:MAG TPA: hypothetical protein VJX30_05755 [Terriglobales bacterium]|jgi:hypothetical protein|nr:hypothetical protein [Terriglobales bacterium]